MTKTEVLDSFFNMGDNSNAAHIEKVRENLHEYGRNYGYDRQIADVLLLCDMFKLEADLNYFKKARKIVTPIINRTGIAIDDFDLYDIRVVATAIGHTQTWRQAYMIGEKLLVSLEKYKNHPRYNHIKRSTHMNIAYGLLHAEYYEDISDDMLEEAFLEHIDAAIDLCTNENFKDFIGTNLVRKGLFLKDFNIVEEGLKYAKENANKAICNMLLDEINEYKAFINNPITEAKLRSIIAKNIKKQREAKNMDIDTLADAIGISSSLLSLVENGEIELSQHNLFKLVEVLKISLDKIFYDTDRDFLS
ncbi:MAG: helix-turn-helix transcriptional regulator [Defluviitaleaceae bacterium]|nr:helix-turn-helix transcriptional regulator [Defluviitaleaceae bacterium]